jgi:hypothetical protein
MVEMNKIVAVLNFEYNVINSVKNAVNLHPYTMNQTVNIASMKSTFSFHCVCRWAGSCRSYLKKKW